MIHKLKRITLPLCIAVATMLLLPAVTQAEEKYESGSISAMRAAEQRAALKAKAERRKAKKAAEAATATPEAPAATPETPAATPEAPAATPEAQSAPEAPKESAPTE